MNTTTEAHFKEFFYSYFMDKYKTPANVHEVTRQIINEYGNIDDLRANVLKHISPEILMYYLRGRKKYYNTEQRAINWISKPQRTETELANAILIGHEWDNANAEDDLKMGSFGVTE